MLLLRVCAIVFLGLAGACSHGVETLVVESKVLADNPLHDPTTRRVALLAPRGSTAQEALPLLVYLPGWGGSSDDFLHGAGGGFAEMLDRLAASGLRLRIAVVDARSRYGGSQFVDSTATGRYGAFTAEEVIPAIARDWKTLPGRCWIAGHSSGGYGALRLAMAYPERFAAVVALSPDSDFEITHKPLVQQPSVRTLSLTDIAAASRPTGFTLPADGLARLVVGLCANYTGTKEPGRFDWLYTASGAWRPEVWQRWLDADPLELVRRNPTALSRDQIVWLDGAEHDEFGANIGARKIDAVLQERGVRSHFYEAPGHHSDGLVERLEKGLRWVQETAARTGSKK